MTLMTSKIAETLVAGMGEDRFGVCSFNRQGVYSRITYSGRRCSRHAFGVLTFTGGAVFTASISGSVYAVKKSISVKPHYSFKHVVSAIDRLEQWAGKELQRIQYAEQLEAIVKSYEVDGVLPQEIDDQVDEHSKITGYTTLYEDMDIETADHWIAWFRSLKHLVHA